jgi:integrase
MMPCSRKGRGEKKMLRRPVPIPQSLAARLRRAATNRPDEAVLLVKPDSGPWVRSSHAYPFNCLRRQLQLGAEVTISALRHSSIVRQLLYGVPIRVVAANHDTSIVMIERTYSKYIADHSDGVARHALLDIAQPTATAGVVPLIPRKRRSPS